jgi:hypothetical protein
LATESHSIDGVRKLVSPPPVACFVLSRGLVWLSALLGFLILRPSRGGNEYHDAGLRDVGWPVDIWANWDGTWYAGIAEHGYRRTSSPAFFPLYPYLARGLGWLLGGHVVLASVLISLAACLVSFLLLHRLTSRLAGPEVANRAVLYLAVFPTALFLQAAYAESLFLMLALATFVLAERGSLVWAGATCGFAMLTRPAGIALVAALVAFALRRSDWKRCLGAVGLSGAVFLAYPLTLWWQRGDAFAFAGAQSHWGRHFSPFGPLIAAFDSVGITIVAIVRLIAPPPPSKAFDEFQHAAFNNVLALLALVMFVALLVAVYRRFGARSPYFVYAAVSLALPLFSPIQGNPLLSLPRFGLAIFPFFIVLASAGRVRPAMHAAYVAASGTLLLIATVAFGRYGWVS